jgi:predicted phosphodiesterase
MLRFILLLGLMPWLCRCQSLSPQMTDERPRALTPENFRVAYVGDLGDSENTHRVLQMIKSERSQLFVILGDFDYRDDPPFFESMLRNTLGDLPLLAVAGNHDAKMWEGYRRIFEKRLASMPEARCAGEIGIKMRCEYQGLVFVLSGVGVFGSFHEQFLTKALQERPANFKICAWHKNQSAMQAGNKKDETGWEVYEICRQEGAMIATAHEHSYARTHLLSSFPKQTVASESQELVLDRGQSFAFVSGLGGKSIRGQKKAGWISRAAGLLNGDRTEAIAEPWWAKIYTLDQNANHSVLFCDYHVDKDPRKARCFLKTIDGEVVDEFTILSKI